LGTFWLPRKGDDVFFLLGQDSIPTGALPGTVWPDRIVVHCEWTESWIHLQVGCHPKAGGKHKIPRPVPRLLKLKIRGDFLPDSCQLLSCRADPSSWELFGADTVPSDPTNPLLLILLVPSLLCIPRRFPVSPTAAAEENLVGPFIRLPRIIFAQCPQQRATPSSQRQGVNEKTAVSRGGAFSGKGPKGPHSTLHTKGKT